MDTLIAGFKPAANAMWKISGINSVQSESSHRQMCRHSPSGIHGYTSPTEEDVPLKGWIREYQGKEAVMP